MMIQTLSKFHLIIITFNNTYYALHHLNVYEQDSSIRYFIVMAYDRYANYIPRWQSMCQGDQANVLC